MKHNFIYSIKIFNLSKIKPWNLFLNSLDALPEIVCCTEHFLTGDHTTNIEGYVLSSAFYRSSSSHGGSCIFVREGMDFIEEIQLKQKSIESQLECSAIISKRYRIIVLCIYRPPSGNIETFFALFEGILEDISHRFKHHNVIISGDFNINLLLDNKISKQLIDLLLTFNFVHTVYEPTRVTKHSKTLIDNIFINFETMPFQSKVVNSALSDHYGILFATEVPKSQNTCNNKIYNIIYSKNKMNTFKNYLSEIDWRDLFSIKDVNEAYSCFLNIFISIKNDIFKPKLMKSKVNNPWITQGIRQSCKNKRLLFYLKNTGMLSQEYYQRYCSILKKVIINAKKLSNSNFILTSNNKSKAMWQVINGLSGRKQIKQQNIIENITGSENPKQILNKINNFYLNQCPDIKKRNLINNKIDKFKKSIYLQPTTYLEIRNIILQLNNTSSVGEDNIPIKLIKYVVNEISGPLEYIVNLMLSTGIFPDRLKIAEIKPVYKKGPTSDISNYRPIALLSNISKVFEKVICTRLVNFLETNQILADCQNGFRKNKSTIRAVYQAISKILTSLNESKATSIICLDLSKAFDSVDHEILLEKLDSYGVRGIAQNLMKTYILNRQQCVVEKDQTGNIWKSDIKTILKGVPQGSILGPVLYIVYTNNIKDYIDKDIIQFADDTSIIISNISNIENETEIKYTIEIMKNWFNENNLLLNINKTQIMNFSYFPNSHRTNYTLPQNVNHINFLGIQLDSALNWKHHIDAVSRQLAKYCFAIRMIRNQVSVEAAVEAYHAFIQSRIRYGIIFWAGFLESNRLFILQKKCIRNLFCLKYTESCKQYFIKHSILTIPALYILESVLFISKNKDLFGDISNHKYNTRHKDNISCETFRYSYLQKNVTFSIINIYNKLPKNVRNLPLNKLKHKLKVFLVNGAYYTVDEFLNSVQAIDV